MDFGSPCWSIALASIKQRRITTPHLAPFRRSQFSPCLTRPSTREEASYLRKITLSDETARISVRALVGIVASELVAIGLGILVAIHWRSWFALLWFASLSIKVFSALVSVKRESLKLTFTTNELSEMSTFRLYHPSRGFMIIRCPSKISNQFFGHYGHPIRNRTRELIQIFLILTLNMIYPIGMICLLWMPSTLQFVWLSYQLYVPWRCMPTATVEAIYLARCKKLSAMHF